MKIGVHGKPFVSDQVDIIKQVLDGLVAEQVELYLSKAFAQNIKDANIEVPYKVYFLKDDLSYLDIFITLGGDGTLLEAVTHVGCSGVPILGVNTGRLGFLATTAKEDIDAALNQLFNKEYTFDQRSLVQLESDSDLFNGLNFALNDFAILKKDTSSMIVVHTYMNDEFLNSYWADGLIISTPTGSTGYSISCGGPLIMPRSDNFVITPVSPHSLTVRPIVIPDESRLSFKIDGRSDNFLVSLDSRLETVNSSVQLSLKKADFKIKLVELKGNSYFKTLRQKLNWGLDIRN